MKRKILGHLNDTVLSIFSNYFCNPLFLTRHFYKMAVIGLRWVKEQTPV